MALSELRFFSEALHMQTSVYVVIPQLKTVVKSGFPMVPTGKNTRVCTYFMACLTTIPSGSDEPLLSVMRRSTVFVWLCPPATGVFIRI